jgi:hypothetical protein
MNIRALLSIASAGLILGVSAPAAALMITPASTPQWTTNDNSNLSTAAQIQAITGLAGLELLYKFNVGGSEEATAFAPSYQSSFAPEAPGGSISYVGGSSILCGVCVLIVKDGNQEPAQYLFNLSAGSTLQWNGTEILQLSGFWPGPGAISNVAIWGGPQVSVPEPGTLGLLGLSLLALGGVARRRRLRA